ncbi:hypothetical protein SLEP1_g22318 [Rubroshorea leprosula]|uniref:Uncharacterized protein n=1 Tax=Rubroshorea leprosula TaxID=152421 RepID=A0AAV5J8T7_9ROSI|nr:hypothetical protein SLEP1_g22318 [Rubroshorea leprosula]
MCEVLNGLIEQIWVENNIQQANQSLDDYQGMVNIIQVQEKLSDDLRTNPFEEKGNDGNQDDSISTTSCDPLHTQGGPVTLVRAKKMCEVLNSLIEQIWVENNIQQANRSLDNYQGMVNIIQVQEKLS